MRHQFLSQDVVPISSGAPTNVSSTIPTENVPGTVRDVVVAIDLDHTFTGDLVIRLTAPGGQSAVLVNREGGSGNNFRGTVFDDGSTSSIAQGFPPFQGRFRPAEPLAQLNESPANGVWTLEVEDRAFRDGGSLNAWAFAFTSEEAIRSEFEIGVRFRPGLSATQRQVFETAAEYWSQIIIGDLPSVQTDIGLVDDVVIDASSVRIDGAGGVNGNILGQAAPTLVRLPSYLPARGRMQFDSFDLGRMESDGSLLNVIIHEMAHVLGHGTIWQDLGLLVGAGTFNPQFLGANAMREFGRLLGTIVPTPVPVANTGGPGTADGHWREQVFGNELLTGRLNAGVNPISRMSIASFQDLGYEVNLEAADTYQLPDPRLLAMMGVDGRGSECCTCHCRPEDYAGVACH